jgi:NAD(P)-dependent dehydrogenase (short-subunit alcohol dehydrogenase family)
MNIQGKNALITGGASGLGAACARMVHAAGGRPVIVDLNYDAGQALAAELGGVFARADVSNPREFAAAIDAAAGPIHIAINCAGIGLAERILGKDGPADLEKFARVIQVNLIGTYNAIRLAAAKMNENEPNADGERGVIVCTASIAAFDGQIGQSAYSASKGGIAGMTLPIARDLARHGIRIVTIAPGLFDTPLLAALPEPARIALGQSIPFPARLGQPAEFAALARHIVENAMLNGEVIRLDGALRMAPK